MAALRVSMMFLLGTISVYGLKADQTTTDPSKQIFDKVPPPFVILWACNENECESCVISKISLPDNDPINNYWPPCVKVTMMKENTFGKVVGKFGKHEVFDTSLTHETATSDIVRDCYNATDLGENIEICLRLHDIKSADDFRQVCADVFAGKTDSEQMIEVPLGCVRANNTGKPEVHLMQFD